MIKLLDLFFWSNYAVIVIGAALVIIHMVKP